MDKHAGSFSNDSSIAALAILFVASGGGLTTAAAAELDQADVNAAAQIVADHKRTISDDAAGLEADIDSGGYSSLANGVTITLPVEPIDGISIETPNTTMEIALPSAATADEARQTGSALLAYDHNDGSYSVPIAGEHGDLQINTVIKTEGAPREYSYKTTLPANARVETVNGSLFFFDEEDALLLMVAAPWATDALGREVPTRYVVRGDTITQVVDHGSDYAYPIVADPWFGWTLFHQFSSGVHLGEKRYSASITPAALIALGNPFRDFGLVGVWQNFTKVMRSDGWAEWKKAWPSLTNKASLKQQFDCHVLAGPYGVVFTGSYDLERSRPNRKNGDWISYVAQHRCNWKNSTGGVKN